MQETKGRNVHWASKVMSLQTQSICAVYRSGGICNRYCLYGIWRRNYRNNQPSPPFRFVLTVQVRSSVHSVEVSEWSMLYGYDNDCRGGDTISNWEASKLERLSNDSNDGRGPTLKLFAEGGEVPMGDRRGGDAAEPEDDMLGRPKWAF